HPLPHPFGNGPRAKPCVAEDRLFSLDETGLLNGYDLSHGEFKPAWGRDLLKNSSAPNLKFGVSASPLFADGLVIVAVGGNGASFVAIDPKPKPPSQEAGAIRWQALNDPASYASPVVIGEGKERQFIGLTAEGV